jgi:hypothetical protein
MLTPRFIGCAAILALSAVLSAALSAVLSAQTPPDTYTITENIPGGAPGTMTIYRSGSRVLIEYKHPAQPDGTPASRSVNLIDIKAGAQHSWDPSGKPITCSASTFSGDWGDPFAGGAELTPAIAKGDLKLTGSETINGIQTKVYAGTTQGMNLKVWFDQKDNLVIRSSFGAPGAAMTTMADIRSISLAPPPASVFALPPACAGVKPPPTAAELIAAETGDDASNYINAIYGPGSKNSCSIVIRVVAAKTMAPITRKWQAAIDTTYNQDDPNPPHYEYGVGNDGTATFSGAGLHEITSQIHNGMLRINNPPAYFNLSTNFIQPGRGAGTGLIYRQCPAPVTMLYYVLKNPADPGDGGDWLYAKSGKYAAVPVH